MILRHLMGSRWVASVYSVRKDFLKYWNFISCPPYIIFWRFDWYVNKSCVDATLTTAYPIRPKKSFLNLSTKTFSMAASFSPILPIHNFSPSRHLSNIALRKFSSINKITETSVLILGWVKKLSAYYCELSGVILIVSVSWIVQRMMSVMSLNSVTSLVS